MSMLSGCASLLVSFSSELSCPSSMGPHSLQSPLASVDNLGVRNIEAYFFFRDAESFPTAFLVVVLDSIPETMGEFKLNSNVQAFMVYEIPLFFRGVYCCLKVPLRNVTLSHSIYRYSFYKDFFCS